MDEMRSHKHKFIRCARVVPCPNHIGTPLAQALHENLIAVPNECLNNDST